MQKQLLSGYMEGNPIHLSEGGIEDAEIPIQTLREYCVLGPGFGTEFICIHPGNAFGDQMYVKWHGLVKGLALLT